MAQQYQDQDEYSTPRDQDQDLKSNRSENCHKTVISRQDIVAIIYITVAKKH